MPLVFVVDAMHFWTLEEVSHPMRRLHIHVVEKLSYRTAESEYRSAVQIEPWQRVDKQATDDRIANHFQGMFDHVAAAGKVLKELRLIRAWQAHCLRARTKWPLPLIDSPYAPHPSGCADVAGSGIDKRPSPR
jgi:hypothetical protein